MPALPFSLRVPGKDSITWSSVSTTTFRFQGLIRLDGAWLHLEWKGSAQVEAVGGLSVRQETLPLPLEQLRIPLDRIRAVQFRGGWWRPRLEVQANDFETLGIVPSEEGGVVQLWIPRGERAQAQALAEAVTQAIRSAPRSPILQDGESPFPTPTSGSY